MGFTSTNLFAPYSFTEALDEYIDRARRERQGSWLWGTVYEKMLKDQYGASPVTSMPPVSITLDYGPSGSDFNWNAVATPTSGLNTSAENGEKQVSNEKVMHELGGKHSFRVSRYSTDHGSERFAIHYGPGQTLSNSLPWLEALNELDKFIAEAEAARAALLEIATYNRPEEPKKGKKNG